MNAAWQAVLEPGRSPAGAPALPETPKSFLGVDAPETHQFLAALSYLSYFPFAADSGGRGERLSASGLEERLFLSCSGVDCSLIVPTKGIDQPHSSSFAAQ